MHMPNIVQTWLMLRPIVTRFRNGNLSAKIEFRALLLCIRSENWSLLHSEGGICGNKDSRNKAVLRS